jgi:hypothetical protein
MDPSMNKKIMKNLDFYGFVTSFNTNVNVPTANQLREKRIYFVGILKAAEEKSRIRIRIRIQFRICISLYGSMDLDLDPDLWIWIWIRICGSGSGYESISLIRNTA